MPAIIGSFFIISVFLFIVLGLTVLSDISQTEMWILDLMIVYFLSLFYFLLLSLFIRYSKANSKEKILKSANTAVLILIVVTLFFPNL